jgi:hypothetical protein
MLRRAVLKCFGKSELWTSSLSRFCHLGRTALFSHDASMSAVGQKLPSCGGSATSAFRLQADILSRGIEVRKVPLADSDQAIRAERSRDFTKRLPHTICYYSVIHRGHRTI